MCSLATGKAVSEISIFRSLRFSLKMTVKNLAISLTFFPSFEAIYFFFGFLKNVF